MRKVILIAAIALSSCHPCLSSKSKTSKESKTSLRGHRKGPVPKNSVAVIGAGISGLTAAYNLKKLGYNVVVFEAEDKIGGKIDSIYLEEGNPSSDFTVLSDEMEAKAQTLCGDERPTDLGAIITTGPNIVDLVNELDVPYGDFALDFKVAVGPLKLSREEYLGYLAAQINPDDPLSEINKALQKFYEVVAKYPEITTARLDDGSEDNKLELAKPLSEFAESHGITTLAESMRPIIAGYGYAYFEDVPAGILLPFIYYSLSNADTPLVSFPCGFQSLLEAMASSLDVRVKARVTKVKRSESSIVVKATGQPPMKFDSLVISTSPDRALSFMSKKEFAVERSLLSKASGYKYMRTVADATGNDGNYEAQFFADQGHKESIDHINVIAKSDIASNAETFYQIMDSDTSPKEAVEVLQEDAKTYWDGTVGSVVKQRLYDNYFPTVSSEDFPTFYTAIENLQGHRNTYYVGSYLSYEVVPFCEEYARDLIMRMFEPIQPN